MKACRDLLIYQCRSKDTEDINAAPRSSALLVSKQSLEHVGTLVPFLEISIDLMFFLDFGDDFGRVFLWFPIGC